MPTPSEAERLHAKYVQQEITKFVNYCRDLIIEEFTGSNSVCIYDYAIRCPDEVMPVVINILEKKGWIVKRITQPGNLGWEISPATKTTKSKKCA